MTKVIELFGVPTRNLNADWQEIVGKQNCPFSGKICFKGRKSEPDVKIGTCTVKYGRNGEPVIICPNRLLDRNQIFVDCLHLLTKHQPGNEYHLIPEFGVPGGSVDFVLASAKDGRVIDFVGIELQTLDTTGTVWPERQKFLKEVGIPTENFALRTFGMNWKMTAKTILVQMHHKAATFSSVNRHLALVLQDPLLGYMRKEFVLDHFASPADVMDTVHFHSYGLEPSSHDASSLQRLKLSTRISTDLPGLEKCLGLKTNAQVTKEDLIDRLSEKLSEATVFSPIR